MIIMVFYSFYIFINCDNLFMQISGIRNQMLTQSLSEQFVDNVVKETLLHIDNISVMQITKAINDTTI